MLPVLISDAFIFCTRDGPLTVMGAFFYGPCLIDKMIVRLYNLTRGIYDEKVF